MKEKAGEKAENGTMMRQSCISGRAMHFMGVMPGQRYAGAARLLNAEKNCRKDGPKVWLGVKIFHF